MSDPLLDAIKSKDNVEKYLNGGYLPQERHLIQVAENYPLMLDEFISFRIETEYDLINKCI